MQLIRQFELMAEEKYKMEGKIRGFFHAYIGQEAIAGGCMTATKADDSFITGYRDHGLALAKGVNANSCMAELYGKATGCAKGKGGSMHFFGTDVKFFGGHGIVGAQIGTGAGLAFAEKYRDSDNVVLCFFGDGAARQGILHETFNLAMLWKLPVIYVCENNQYAMTVSLEKSTAVKQLSVRGAAYGFEGKTIDGNDVEAVYEATEQAAAKGRGGGGATFLECVTYRWDGHFGGDPGTAYRSKEEIESWKQRCPIKRLKEKLIREGHLTEAEFEKMSADVYAELDAVARRAEAAPLPAKKVELDAIYASSEVGHG